MGFLLQQKSMILMVWMTLNVNLLLCRQCYAYYDQTAEASKGLLRGFRYKVALDIEYLRFKFNDEIQRNSFEL